jgi:hypothetical protein
MYFTDDNYVLVRIDNKNCTRSVKEVVQIYSKYPNIPIYLVDDTYARIVDIAHIKIPVDNDNDNKLLLTIHKDSMDDNKPYVDIHIGPDCTIINFDKVKSDNIHRKVKSLLGNEDRSVILYDTNCTNNPLRMRNKYRFFDDTTIDAYYFLTDKTSTLLLNGLRILTHSKENFVEYVSKNNICTDLNASKLEYSFVTIDN